MIHLFKFSSNLHGCFGRQRLPLVILLVFVWQVIPSLCQQEDQATGKRLRNEPRPRTVLSVIDDRTQDYFSLTDHPYLNHWRSQLRYPEHFRETNKPTLTLDKKSLSKHHETLTVSWDPTQFLDSDILALYCSYSKDHDGFKSEISMVDAATLAQARATSQRHCKDSLWSQASLAESRRLEHQNHEMHPCFTNRNATASANHKWCIHRFPSSIRASWCEFVLHRLPPATHDTNSNSAIRTLSRSPRIALKNSKIPTNIHLSLTRDPEELLVQFTTGNEGVPIALYGTSKNPSEKVEGTSTTYTADDLCGAPANQTGTSYFCDPGQLHTIILRHLKPSTVYHYKVGVTFGQGVVWREQIFQFQSPPASAVVDSKKAATLRRRRFINETTVPLASTSNNSEPYTFLVYGNQGCPSLGWGMGGLWTTMGIMAQLQDSNATINAVHHIGGLSYAKGVGHVWDEWLSMTESFATRVPLMVAVGSSEYDHLTGGFYKDPSGYNESHGYMPTWGNYGDDSGGECGVPTSKRFQMPTTGNGVFWYSYNSASLLHTIVLSSEHDLTADSPQHKWLLEDLRAVNRTVTPWIIVELHRPLYNNQALWSDNDVGIGLRHSFEILLKDHHVDLVLSGHYPTYFRSCPGLYDSSCQNGGPTHVTVGSGGALLEVTNLYEADWAIENIQGVYGFAKVTIHNHSALEFDFIQAGPPHDNSTGEVLDHFWIARQV